MFLFFSSIVNIMCVLLTWYEIIFTRKWKWGEENCIDTQTLCNSRQTFFEIVREMCRNYVRLFWSEWGKSLYHLSLKLIFTHSTNSKSGKIVGESFSAAGWGKNCCRAFDGILNNLCHMLLLTCRELSIINIRVQL